MSTVDSYVAALGRALHGPADVRRGMLDEVRDGLVDAAEALQHGGLAPATAAERAVREFGTVEELAPQFQAELVLAQSRRTAMLMALAFPATHFGWDLLWVNSTTPPGEELDGVALLLVGGMDLVAWIVPIAAAVALALTWRRRARPRALALTGAAVGLAAAAFCVVGGLALSLGSASGRPVLAALLTGPVALAVFAGSGVTMYAVIRSTTRTLRLATRRPAGTAPR